MTDSEIFERLRSADRFATKQALLVATGMGVILLFLAIFGIEDISGSAWIRDMKERGHIEYYIDKDSNREWRFICDCKKNDPKK